MKYIHAMCISFSVFCSCNQMPMLFEKKLELPQTADEEQFVNHVITSFDKSLRLESKLQRDDFSKDIGYKKSRRGSLPQNYSLLKDFTLVPYYHLLNNLCSYSDGNHLHVGLLAGDSFISALYKNQSTLCNQIGVDWFEECPESTFMSNCEKYLDSKKFRIINKGCFDVDKSQIKCPINIYFYDADHGLIGHKMAITYYDEVFANCFVVVIDDWECPWIRRATFQAFEELNYSCLYESFIDEGSLKKCQYVGVFRKAQ